MKWRALGEEINHDPWGRAYKIALRKLAPPKPSEVRDAATMDHIVDTLFPTHPLRGEDEIRDVGDFPLFTIEELQNAVRTMKNNKAPGPDGIPVEALKVAVRHCPHLLLDMYNSCLKMGSFPKKWKLQRLVLISKGKGDPNSPSAYRPLCLLDTAGKLLEKLLKPRLDRAVQYSAGLSDRQYGFREGRSTIDATRKITEAAGAAQRSGKICVLVTLDVKNAFNSLRWVDALDVLKRRFKVPPYLLRMVQDYLRERVLQYDTTEGQRTTEVTGGAAQGSVLGPDIWNDSYDELLDIPEMPGDTFLVGYADDAAVVILARDEQEAQSKLTTVMTLTSAWMSEHGLQLAVQKTEIVLLTRKRIDTSLPMRVNDTLIAAGPSIRYLGIHLDTKLRFFEHISRVADKAAQVTSALSSIMANIGGPKPSKRRLLMSVAHSILLYGAEVWADALDRECRRKKIAAVQRRCALRVASAYRTVSEAAVLAVTGIMPIKLMARQRKQTYETRRELGNVQATEISKNNAMEAWQHEWSYSDKGRWTVRLIPNLRVWVDRKHGEVNYYLTQFLTGHGFFLVYLHRMDKVSSPNCIYCNGERDDAEHTFFSCSRWHQKKNALETEVGSLTPDNVVEVMLRNEENWDAVSGYVEAILRQKKAEEHLVTYKTTPVAQATAGD